MHLQLEMRLKALRAYPKDALDASTDSFYCAMQPFLIIYDWAHMSLQGQSGCIEAPQIWSSDRTTPEELEAGLEEFETLISLNETCLTLRQCR